MKILIAVPSKNRWRENEIQRKTLAWLIYTKYDYRIFVEPQDYNYYNSIIGIKDKVVDIGENDRGIGFAKIKIQQYAEKYGFDYVFKLDDDIIGWRDPANRGLGRSAPKRSKEYRCKVLFEPIIERSLEMFKEMGELVGGVTIPYGNEMREYDSDKIWIGVNKRLQCCYIIRTDLFCSKHSLEFNTFVDFLDFVYLIKSGFKTLTYGQTGIEYDGIGNRPGGLQDNNRLIRSLHTMSVAKKVYPDLVWKKVNKIWKFEPDFSKTKFIERIKL